MSGVDNRKPNTEANAAGIVLVNPTNNSKPTHSIKPKVTIKASILKLSDIVALNTRIRSSKKVFRSLKISPKKVAKLKARQVSIDPNFIVNPEKEYNTAQGSIQRVIDECHPDIRNFFDSASVKQYNVTPAHLLIKLDSGVRISITCLRDNKKKYKIIDTKGVELLSISDK